jgi:hypothetical protein
MDHLTGEEVERLARAVDKLGEVSKKLQAGSGGSEAHINIQAGGVGLWIAATCCAVMFALTIAMAVIGGIAYTSTQQRLDRMQDYLNVIYQAAPQLKTKNGNN